MDENNNIVTFPSNADANTSPDLFLRLTSFRKSEPAA